MSAPEDPEIAAMRAIVDALEPLSVEQRTRVLATMICLFDQEAATAVVRWRTAAASRRTNRG